MDRVSRVHLQQSRRALDETSLRAPGECPNLRSQFVICQTGASSLLAPYNLPLWQCVDPMDDDDDSDVEHFGELPVYGALGVSSMPWP